MVVVGVVGQSEGPSLAYRWPQIFTSLARDTPSIKNLTPETAAASGSILDMSDASRLPVSRGVSILYGMSAWAILVGIGYLFVGIIGALKANKVNPEYEKLKAPTSAMLFIGLTMCAMVILGRYPFHSDQFLRRCGILREDFFWWSQSFMILAAVALSLITGFEMLFKLAVKRRTGRT
jgi:hypothetical protein